MWFLLLLIVFFGAWAIWGFIMNVKAKNNAKKAELQNNKKLFYEECKKSGIANFSTEKELQKAELLAKKYSLDLTGTSVAKLYKEGKDIVNEERIEDKEKKIKAQKAKETTEYNRLVKFAGYYGREKRIAILKDELAATKREIEELRTATTNAINLSQQPEHSWAIHGGIANGIAGPAAGLAVASDIQTKNAAIRAQNQANLKSLTPLINGAYNSMYKSQDKIDYLNELILNAGTKLVSSDSKEECFSKLKISNTTIDVTKTGTITVTATIKVKEEPLFIYDDVSAIIDGTIGANIYYGDTLIGTARIVAPVYGFNEKDKLTGMCLFCGETSKKGQYSVKYEPINLWAMEI